MSSRSRAGVLSSGKLDDWAIPGLFAASIVLSALASSGRVWNSSLAGNGRWIVLAAIPVVATPAGFRRLRQALLDRYSLAFLAWVGLAFVSATWSVDSSLTLKRAFSLALLYAAVLVGAAVYVRGRREVARLALGVLTGIAIVLVMSIVDAWIEPGHAIQPAFSVPGQGAFPARFQGITQNPNTIASYGFIVLPLLLWRLAVDRGRLRLAWLVLLGLALAEVIWSGTRTSLALMLAELALFGWAFGGARGRRAVVVLVAAALLGVSALVVARNGDADFVVRAATFNHLGGRTIAWRAATKLIERRPVDGYGFGTEPVVFAHYTAAHVQQFRDAGFLASFVHNSYLSAALQLGVPGALLMVLLLVAPAVALVRGPVGVEPSLALAIGAAVGASALNAIMSSYLTSVGNVITVSTWLLAGLCLTARRTELADVPPRQL